MTKYGTYSQIVHTESYLCAPKHATYEKIIYVLPQETLEIKIQIQQQTYINVLLSSLILQAFTCIYMKSTQTIIRSLPSMQHLSKPNMII